MVAHCFSGMASMIFRSRSSYGTEGAALMAEFAPKSATFAHWPVAVVQDGGPGRPCLAGGNKRFPARRGHRLATSGCFNVLGRPKFGRRRKLRWGRGELARGRQAQECGVSLLAMAAGRLERAYAGLDAPRVCQDTVGQVGLGDFADSRHCCCVPGVADRAVECSLDGFLNRRLRRGSCRVRPPRLSRADLRGLSVRP